MSVLPEKERPAPPKVVVWSLPFRSAERRVFAAAENTVEELNVAVALKAVELLKAAVPEKACAAVHVTELAAVTKPGFVKVIVWLPVAFVSEVRPVPAVLIAVTPVFMTEKTLELVWSWIPVEAFNVIVLVSVPNDATYWVLETR